MEIKFADLERLFDKIKIVLDKIEKNNTYNRYFNLYLANGDCLYYHVPSGKIPHLLGIKPEGLVNHKVFGQETNYYKLLKLLLDNAYKINSLVSKGQLRYDEIFSEHIESKLDSILDNLKIDVDKTEIVCKYNSLNALISGENSEKCDYIIIKKYDDGKIGVLMLVKEENGYIPMSNRIYENLEDAENDLKKFLNNQVLTFLTGIKVGYYDSTYESSYSLNFSLNRKKSLNLENIKRKYNASADTNHQLAYSSNIAMYNNEAKKDENIDIGIIAECIRKRMLIESIPDYSRLAPIADAINDLLFQLDNNGIDSDTSYTEIMKELNELKDKLLKADSTIKALSNGYESVSKELKELKPENAELKMKLQKIYEISKPS